MLMIRNKQGLPTMESFVNDFFGLPSLLNEKFVNRNFVGDVNVAENEDSYELSVALPGYKKDDVSIEIEDDVLVIKSDVENKTEDEGKNYVRKEYYKRSFERRFVLSDDIDINKIDAKMEDGILNIIIDKIKELKTESVKKIDIK